MKVPSRFIKPLFALSIGCAAFAQVSSASWNEVPLNLRLKDAEIVVVGKLDGIRSNVYKSELIGSGYKTYYNTANISVESWLKGSSKADIVSVKFANPQQPNHPFRHMFVTPKSGQRGIWLLHRTDTGEYSVRRPDNFIGLDELPDVEKALEENDVAERVRVQQNNDVYEARIEGRSEIKNATGNTEAEALGELILSNPDVFEIKVTTDQHANSVSDLSITEPQPDQ
jgi:hypothetical protein